MVSAIGSNSATNLDTQTVSAQNSLRQQDFLKLLVSQVQNQDPLNPQGSGEFLSQLAQFSTNDSINQMQESLAQLASSLQSNQALQASALVGREVLVNSDKLSLGAEGDAKASITMSSGLTNLNASIYSSTGELVKTISLGQPPAGNFEFAWDGTDGSGGRAAAGSYSVKVTGTSNGSTVTVPTMISANVDSVTLGQNGEGLKLNLAGVGAVALSDIKQISV